MIIYYVDKGKAKDKTHIALYNDKGILIVPCMGKPLKNTTLLDSTSPTMRTGYWCKSCMKHLGKIMIKKETS
jgi:hypothetical protein